MYDQILVKNLPVLVLIVLWILPWKGIALWKAARKNHLGWFIAILVLNTLAILEILYIFIFSKKTETQIKANEDKDSSKAVF